MSKVVNVSRKDNLPYTIPPTLYKNLVPSDTIILEGNTFSGVKTDKCPICGSVNIEMLGQVKVKTPDTNKEVILNYDKCVGCGIAFQNPAFEKNFRDKLYDLENESYYKSFGSDEVDLTLPKEEIWRKIIADNRIQALMKILGDQKSCFVDLGAGLGTVMEVGGYYFSEIKGIEVSKPATDYISKRGLDVFYGDITKARRAGYLSDGSVDLLLMISIIEHLEEFGSLVDVRDVLNPQGLLYILTPDIMTTDTANRHRYFQLHHRLLFSYKALKDLLESYSLFILFCGPSQYVRIDLNKYQINPKIVELPEYKEALDYVEHKKIMLETGHWQIGLIARRLPSSLATLNHQVRVSRESSIRKTLVYLLSMNYLMSKKGSETEVGELLMDLGHPISSNNQVIDKTSRLVDNYIEKNNAVGKSSTIYVSQCLKNLLIDSNIAQL